MNEHQKSWFAVVGVILSAFMALMDIHITNAAIEKILSALSATMEEGSWITSSYLIAEIIMIPATRALVEKFGLYKLSVTTCVFFILSSILCAQSWDLTSMIIFRIMQGLSGGVLMPLAYITIMQRLNHEQHGKAMSIFGIISSLAPAIGPAIAGSLVEIGGWESLFYINIPIGVVVLTCIFLGNSRHTKAVENNQKVSTDYLGFISIAIGLGCLVFVLEEGYRKDWFESGLIRFLTLISLLSLVFFVHHALRTTKPLIELRLLREQEFFVACISSFIGGISLFSCVYLVPYFLASIQGYSPYQISEVILLMALPQSVFSLMVISFIKRFNLHALIASGFFLFSISCWMCSEMSMYFSGEQFFIPLLFRALGMPLIMIPLGLFAIRAVKIEDSGSASVLFNISRSLGGALGIAFIIALISRHKDLFFKETINHLSLSQFKDIQSTSVGTYIDIDRVSLHDNAQLIPALISIENEIIKKSHIMAFNEAFLGLALILFITGGAFFMIYLVSFLRNRMNQNESIIL